MKRTLLIIASFFVAACVYGQATWYTTDDTDGVEWYDTTNETAEVWIRPGYNDINGDNPAWNTTINDWIEAYHPDPVVWPEPTVWAKDIRYDGGGITGAKFLRIGATDSLFMVAESHYDTTSAGFIRLSNGTQEVEITIRGNVETMRAERFADFDAFMDMCVKSDGVDPNPNRNYKDRRTWHCVEAPVPAPEAPATPITGDAPFHIPTGLQEPSVEFGGVSTECGEDAKPDIDGLRIDIEPPRLTPDSPHNEVWVKWKGVCEIGLEAYQMTLYVDGVTHSHNSILVGNPYGWFVGLDSWFQEKELRIDMYYLLLSGIRVPAGSVSRTIPIIPTPTSAEYEYNPTGAENAQVRVYDLLGRQMRVTFDQINTLPTGRYLIVREFPDGIVKTRIHFNIR